MAIDGENETVVGGLEKVVSSDALFRAREALFCAFEV